MIYFSYGSNTNPQVLKKRIPKAKALETYCLDGYEFSFVGYSQHRKGGVASILQNHSNFVMGVLWDIPENGIHHLDYIEGLHNKYEKIKIQDEKFGDIISYVSDETYLNVPTEFYLKEIIIGYLYFNLSLDQLKKAYKGAMKNVI
jgi:gamma-glutamylcyclotransferase (GGCT)/AIG2-like uncharacterized protein YtfP